MAESRPLSATAPQRARRADAEEPAADRHLTARTADESLLPVRREDVDPNLVVVYTASSQGYLEPCGCYARHKEMGGIARRATFVDSLRAAGDPLLLVEAGDFVGGGGDAGLRIGETTLRVMRAMGYDVIALGEAEVALGEGFLKMAAAAGPPVAHANYSHPVLGPAQKQGLLIERNGLRIGVIGLLDPETLPPDLPLENLVIDPPDRAAAAAAASLRAAGADLIVVLGHASFRRSGRLAEAAGEPDLWVVGHGGKELSRPAQLARTLLLGSGNGGKRVGALRLSSRDGAPLEFANLLYPLYLTVPEKSSIAKMVNSAAR